MVLSMRFSRLLTVLFVAFALVGWSPASARSHSDDGAPSVVARVDAPTSNVGSGAPLPDPVMRVVVVAALAGEIEIRQEWAGVLLDAMTEAVMEVADAAARHSLLSVPAPGLLMDIAFEIAAAADPAIAQVATNLAGPSDQRAEAAAIVRVPEPIAVHAGDLDGGETGPMQRWQRLVEQYFPAERVNEALSIIDCESGGDPDARNPRSSATGLFQFIDGTWAHASEQAGFGGALPNDPEANVAAAAWLVDHSISVGVGPWTHWTCRP